MVGLALVLNGEVYAGGKPGKMKPANQKAIASSVGEFHACALLADGSVQCWGANGEGQPERSRESIGVGTIAGIMDFRGQGSLFA